MKKYSKKQIQKSINYWNNILRQIELCESKSKVVHALVSEFGKALVYDKSTIDVSEELLSRIFCILNLQLFDSKLKQIPILYLSYKVIAQKLDESDDNKEQIYSKTLENDFSGVYNVVVNDILDKNGSLVNLAPEENTDVIYMNSSYLKENNFAFIVASLCHEMIHYYDKEFGEMLDCKLKSLQLNIKVDSHTTPTFKKLMKTANENNIRVIASLSGYTYDQLLSGAYDTLVEENDDKSEDFSHISGKCIVVTNGHRRHLFEFD